MTRKMKDSGIEWIGMIPEGWDVLKLNSSYSFGKGLSITKADLCEQGLGLISYGQIHSKDNIGASVRESLIRYLPFDHESLSDNSRVSINDIIFADTSEDLDGCGNCIFIDSENVKYAGYHTIILHPKNKETSRYFGYLFATDAWKTQIRENASGVKVYSITQDMLKNAYLLAPPIATQHQIVSFLDAKCAQIDALIEAKEKSNNLLKEYRQSIIFESVTKGLDPNVPMKDSGIEWIGMIPEGWNVVKVKHIGAFKSGDGITSENIRESDSYPVYGGNGIRGFTDSYTHQGQYLLIGRQGALCGNVHLVNGTFWASEHAVVGSINKGFNVSYAFYVLDVFGLNRLSITAAQPGISVEQISQVMIPCPKSLSEQTRIANYLDAKCAEIDALIEANEKTIRQLKEYRQSVIFEAVTGKLEV